MYDSFKKNYLHDVLTKTEN